jgi:hypothetical protein
LLKMQPVQKLDPYQKISHNFINFENENNFQNSTLRAGFIKEACIRTRFAKWGWLKPS